MPKTQNTLTMEYDHFINDIKAGQGYLCLELIQFILTNKGVLNFVITHANRQKTDPRTSFTDLDEFINGLSHINAIHG